ncbi:MAG: histidine phosphatase family protein [Candidatus Dormibacteria bacterium]
MQQRARLYLVRHCDVANPNGVLYGYLPGFGLSDKGLAQAESLGQRLAGQPVRMIRTSPLERARQTTSIIARHLDRPEVVVDDDLVEARFSLYLQGVRYAQVPWRRPLWWVHMVWPGLLRRDERVGAMAGRVERSLERLLESVGDGTGVCVSHGDPIQAFWITHLHRHPWALHHLQCAKGGLLALDYEAGKLTRVTYVPPQLAAPAGPDPVGEQAGETPAADPSQV